MPANPMIPEVSADDPVHPESLSDLLSEIVRKAGPQITLREISEALDERSFGAFLLVFAIPNLIPLPPGATLVLGLPLLFVAWQIVSGPHKIWLPQRLANYSIRKKTLEKVIHRCDPWLKWMEAWIRPRNWPLRKPIWERIFGIYILFLAIIVVIPIPLGNWLPAFALAIIGLSHTEQDGNCLGIGTIIGIFSAVIVALILFLTKALFAAVL
mgnify:FL=1